MVKVLFDTNILVDKTLNIEQAEIELASYDDAAISAITWMESTVKLDDQAINDFDQRLALTGIKVVHTSDAIMRLASKLRATSSTKLPDCIIRATALIEGRTIITRNPGDFGGVPACHVPYQIEHGSVVDIKPPLE